jgi:hypothetical protein
MQTSCSFSYKILLVWRRIMPLGRKSHEVVGGWYRTMISSSQFVLWKLSWCFQMVAKQPLVFANFEMNVPLILSKDHNRVFQIAPPSICRKTFWKQLWNSNKQ